MSDLDGRVRLAAFTWLSEQVRIHGDVLPRSLLAEGFVFEDQRVPLVGPQGIFKPRLLPQMPLSITTTPEGPYDDSFGPDNLLLYRYRGIDPQHRDNSGLRMAYFHKAPLIYFHGVVPGKYLAVWPVFIVADDPQKLTFKVAVDDLSLLTTEQKDNTFTAEPTIEARRLYLTSLVKQRLHQRGFRERVLRAYREQCAFCRLRHLELLDAAHIIPDSEPDGEATVNNGISLCKFHHAAFDRLLLGIRPDCIIEVRKDVLEEKDGPMLLHGLQGLHLQRILIPSSSEMRPNPDLLDRRYQRFRAMA
ncbi:MAG: HNH endonuclease [Deltaproteobacteria bacterium HGW-Deltaproteobacteria-15]|nr:MAG: HNH endonuclease [Deltaproteobacteria bacterium HGW-Deltaproteobacteria-15]